TRSTWARRSSPETAKTPQCTHDARGWTSDPRTAAEGAAGGTVRTPATTRPHRRRVGAGETRVRRQRHRHGQAAAGTGRSGQGREEDGVKRFQPTAETETKERDFRGLVGGIHARVCASIMSRGRHSPYLYVDLHGGPGVLEYNGREF